MQRVRLISSGDVVGVGYRAWVLRYVQDKPLTGWVKNRQDRTVELVAEGPRGDLEDLIKQCQHGPEVAWVEKVDAEWGKATGEFMGF
ncbi:acylphosphatase, partial [Candidatus Gottesmanbacteria bacterium]|nr:acylphosphatase [Candidatus Gottesmanbacteria bacterium]